MSKHPIFCSSQMQLWQTEGNINVINTGSVLKIKTGGPSHTVRWSTSVSLAHQRSFSSISLLLLSFIQHWICMYKEKQSVWNYRVLQKIILLAFSSCLFLWCCWGSSTISYVSLKINSLCLVWVSLISWFPYDAQNMNTTFNTSRAVMSCVSFSQN